MDRVIEITSLPKRSTLLFDGVPVELNQKIKVDQQSLITLQNSTGYKGIPFDFFNYKISNESQSKEATVTVAFPTNGLLAITETGETVDQLDQVLWFDDYVAYDESWDRITIEEIQFNGRWILGKRSDGVQIHEDKLLEVGKTYMCYEIHNLLRFEVVEEGIVDHYAELYFRKGTQTNTGDLSLFDIQCMFLGIQKVISEPYYFLDENGDYNLLFETEIYKSFGMATANMSVDTSALSQLLNNPENYLKITSLEGVNQTITTMANIAFDALLNEKGRTTLFFHLFLKGGTAIEETIKSELVEINSNFLFVDPANVLLNINTLAT